MTAPTLAPATLTTADLLLEWDRRRPRTLQTEFGMSGLGECRRRAGYHLAGILPSDSGGSLQAVMGTVIHDSVASVLKELQAEGLIPADDLIEHEVHFAGIKGHLDRYEPHAARLTDTKTTSSRWLEKVKITGPTTANLWQAHGYAAGLIVEGYPVRTIAIDYIARDTGDEWRWTGRFDPQHVRDALAWVDDVRTTELDHLSRDHDPKGPFCENCPFFTRCWEGHVPGRDERSVLLIEDPDQAAWAAKLKDARDRKNAAEKEEKEAKGALDALRPNNWGVGIVRVEGFGKDLKFTVTRPERVDTKQVRKDYEAAGRPVPLLDPKPQVKVELVEPAADDPAEEAL